MNNKLGIGDNAVCTYGSMKGHIFIVKEILNDSYSCERNDINDKNRYNYDDSCLQDTQEYLSERKGLHE